MCSFGKKCGCSLGCESTGGFRKSGESFEMNPALKSKRNFAHKMWPGLPQSSSPYWKETAPALKTTLSRQRTLRKQQANKK